MATSEEIAWAAGLFDGEGSITHTDRDLQLVLKNTDLELVERFDRIVGRGRVYGPYDRQQPDGHRRKPFWMWLAHGDAGEDVIHALAPWLSCRRRAQAVEHGVQLLETNRENGAIHVLEPNL